MSEFMPGQFPKTTTLPSGFQIRGDDAGAFDELWGRGADVHLEMMDDGTLWLNFEVPGLPSVTMVVTAEKRGKLFVKLEQEPALTRP